MWLLQGPPLAPISFPNSTDIAHDLMAIRRHQVTAEGREN